MNHLFLSVFHTGLIASILLAVALAIHVGQEEQRSRRAALARRNVTRQIISQTCYQTPHDTAIPADLYNIVVIDLARDEERLLQEIEGR